MKYGLLEYTTNNIGDEIQSIAAKQHLPRVDEYVKRDYLNQVESEEDIKLILNGWFSHKPHNWPPSSDIDPLFISFHISDEAKDSYTSAESIEYFSQHEPIGCRDIQTRDLLRKNGVEAYFSGCLTLTLSNEHSNRSNGNIYVVDVGKEVINEMPNEIYERAEHLTHNYSASSPEGATSNPLRETQEKLKQFVGSKLDHTKKDNLRRFGIGGRPHNERKHMKFQQAQSYLTKYAQAELVITRRLHVTLPCIAFNTPVILVHENPNDPRFTGLKDYMNIFSTEEFNELSSAEIMSIKNNPGDITNITKNTEKTLNRFLSDSSQENVR